VSIRSTNFVRGLRGLSPSEKAVAFVLADHDDRFSVRGSFASMSTVAEEAGLRNRETASLITKRLLDRGIIRTDNPSRGRKCTVYRFNYDLANRDCRVTVENPRTVIPQSRLRLSNRDSTTPPTVTQEGSNRDSPVTLRVEGKEEGGASLMQFSQDQQDPKRQEQVPTPRHVKKAIGKISQQMHISAAGNGGQRARLEAGIHRKEIGEAYFDATNANMEPDECIRQAILAGALSLVTNRSVELRGLGHEDLARNVWERIRKNIQALHDVTNFETRSQHVVAVVTNYLTNLAMEFWERAGTDIGAATHRSDCGERRASGAA
jgi:hypothetical protein